MAIATGTAVALAAGATALGAGATIYSSRQAKKAAQATNAANERMASDANKSEMLRYYESRGGAMGASMDELMARPGQAKYDPDLSVFNEDGTAKRSAVMPLYLSGLEQGMSGNIEDKYNQMQEMYDPQRMQNVANEMAGAEQGMMDAVNDLYSGQEFRDKQNYLDNIQDTRLSGLDNILSARMGANQGIADARMQNVDGLAQAREDASLAQAQVILNEAQRNAAQQDFTGRSGIVGNSGNAQANTLQALMTGYGNAAQNAAKGRLATARDRGQANVLNAMDSGKATEADALARAQAREKAAGDAYNLYKSDLSQRKENQAGSVIGGVASNQQTAQNAMMLPEMATSKALNAGGFQLGQGRMPEYNVAAQVPVPRGPNPFSVVGDALKTGLGFATMFGGMGGGGTGGAISTLPSYDYNSLTSSYGSGGSGLGYGSGFQGLGSTPMVPTGEYDMSSMFGSK